jgi:formyltetrahydrofolate-dependent phosphoribosylglycinamide formyltransferase
MFKRLQDKWKVTPSQLFWILCVFAITGTTTAWVSKAITGWLNLGPDSSLTLRIFIRTMVLLFGYQIIILIVSIPFGQFRFFWNYEKKILRWMGLMKPQAQNLPSNTHNQPQPYYQLAVFASGAGSNAQQIIHHFQKHPSIRVALIVCNKPEAGVLSIAQALKIPTLLIEKERFFRGDAYLPELKAAGINFLVLAGFLWKVPESLIRAFPDAIVNIHPALLPNYGGKGMYGEHVHKAVIQSGDTQSGITIHRVDERYDHGETLFQATCPVSPDDTPVSLAAKVHQLEHTYYPQVIEELLLKK